MIGAALHNMAQLAFQHRNVASSGVEDPAHPRSAHAPTASGSHIRLTSTYCSICDLPPCHPQELTGSADGVLAAQRSPATPLQRMASHAQEVAGQVASLKQARKEAAGHAYLEYVLDAQLRFAADPSNSRFEELELPELIKVGGVGWV